MDNNTVEKIRKALLKRALGYNTLETVVEYSGDGEDCTVVRKKVTKKNVPPDISAAKLLLEDGQTDGYSMMTDEQLEAEKLRLLSLLKGECAEKGESFGKNERAEKIGGAGRSDKASEAEDREAGSVFCADESPEESDAPDAASLKGDVGAGLRTGKGEGGRRKKCKN